MKYPIEYKPGESLDLSSMAIGCWAFADESSWGKQDRKESVATLHAAVDQGINFFDTAPAYGQGASETLLGEVFRERRDEVVIATKVGRNDLREQDLRRSCEESLRRLQTDYIDLYQLHWPSHEIHFGETLEILRALQAEGKIRAFGVCNFGPKDLAEWLAIGGPATTNQLGYSLLARAVEGEVVPSMNSVGMRLLAYCPLMQGLLTGKFANADAVPPQRARSRHFRGDRPLSRLEGPGCEELTFATLEKLRHLAEEWTVGMAPLALAWLLHQNVLGSVIVGVRSRPQLERNLVAARLKLSPGQVAALDAATDDLKEEMGPECDLWAFPSRMR